MTTRSLRALLQQQLGSADSAESVVPADPLATQPIAITLTLSPATQFTGRIVQGVIGIQGQVPIFLPAGVCLSDLLTQLDACYSQLGEQVTVPSSSPVGSVESAATTLASTPAEATPSSLLDLF